jgi:hypothetical protein
MATPPGRGHVGANVASSETAGSALRIPRQFGPTMRIPASRTTASTSSSRRRPASPTSRKPAVITTMPRTPCAAQSRAAWSTPSRGTVITARSTGPGTSASEA